MDDFSSEIAAASEMARRVMADTAGVRGMIERANAESATVRGMVQRAMDQNEAMRHTAIQATASSFESAIARDLQRQVDATRDIAASARRASDIDSAISKDALRHANASREMAMTAQRISAADRFAIGDAVRMAQASVERMGGIAAAEARMAEQVMRGVNGSLKGIAAAEARMAERMGGIAAAEARFASVTANSLVETQERFRRVVDAQRLEQERYGHYGQTPRQIVAEKHLSGLQSLVRGQWEELQKDLAQRSTVNEQASAIQKERTAEEIAELAFQKFKSKVENWFAEQSDDDDAST